MAPESPVLVPVPRSTTIVSPGVAIASPSASVSKGSAWLPSPVASVLLSTKMPLPVLVKVTVAEEFPPALLSV